MSDLNGIKSPVDEKYIATLIMQKIFERRRLHPQITDETVDISEEMAPHVSKVIRSVALNQPIKMVLPAFPAKSPSRRKTLSHLPDHGEEIGLTNLNNLCKEIASVYEPGARVVVCSDGRVFADVVRIPDDHVSAYNSALRQMASGADLDYIEFFDLDDVYESLTDYTMLREDLMVLHGEALTSLQERSKSDAQLREMYLGVTKFLLEDFSGIEEFSGLSRNAIQKMAKAAAYRVIQRSNAWGRLLEERFPEAVRLSIHPQFRVSNKIGINLVDSNDRWGTPWHSVVLMHKEGVSLVRREDAERMNAALIFRDGRPSHYRMID